MVCGVAMLALGASKAPAGRPIRLALHPYGGTTLRTVDVTVGGEVRPFILDTGAGFTVIDPDEVGKAGCSPFGRVVGFRADGQEVTLKRCGPVTLDIAGYRARGEVGVFNLDALLGKGAPPVGGLVGMDSFDHDAVTLDLSHDRLIVETRRSLAKRIRDLKPVHVRIVRGAGGDVVPFLEVRAHTGTVWMEIDSGNNGPVFLAPHALTQLGVRMPAAGRGAIGLDIMGLGRATVTAARRKMIYDGELNSLFLRKIVLTIDFADGRAWAGWRTR